jgi:alpha-glucan phosphorylase, H isozyme
MYVIVNRYSVDLSKVITDTLQTEEWAMNLKMLSLLSDHAEEPEFQMQWEQAHTMAKKRLADFIEKTQGIQIPESFLFDVMVKRIHEYKRQLMNILYCIYRYRWIKGMTEEERKNVVPRVVIFGGKAAPSYHRAKNVIKLINNVSEVVNNDPEMVKYLRIVFIPDYSVSKAELIIPAADITQHISTAGTEASGTR